MMSAILFDIHTLQSGGVQTHAPRHRFKVNVHTPYSIPCNYYVFPLAHTSALSTVKCICWFLLGGFDRSSGVQCTSTPAKKSSIDEFIHTFALLLESARK